MTRSQPTRIGIVGTFDLENYGDLLFPLLAQEALGERLGDVEVRAYSYHERRTPSWPFAVRSVADLPGQVGELDALLVGGGFVLRFDPDVAPGYGPPSAAIHHPTGYWLTPLLLALQHGVPVVWNAPGMHDNEVPTWARPLVRDALALSRHVAVRDEPTAAALRAVADPATRISVVPDTAFGLRIAEPGQEPSAALRTALQLDRPYVVVQASESSRAFADFAIRHAAGLEDLALVALPVGPVLGDHASLLADVPGIVTLPEWPEPLVLADLVRHAELAVGHSYHLAITALTAGVPLLTPGPLDAGKYTALAGLGPITALDPEADAAGFRALLGRRQPADGVAARRYAVDRHWDRVADVVRAGRTSTAVDLGRLLQRLPADLEAAASTASAATDVGSATSGRVEELERVLELARRTTAGRVDALDVLRSSPSWRLTGPLRAVRRRLRPAASTPGDVLRMRRLLDARLERSPFDWASIDGLYAEADAADLARTYPRDHFKTVSARGGEKDYDYEVRELIRMRDTAVSRPEHLSPAWSRLAEDLRSPQYRDLVSMLTGVDLDDAPLEVNVYHFGPRALLGAHTDLPDKLVTHVLYFNDGWDPADGGCLSILGSADPDDVVTQVQPLVGSSALLVRSDRSWHAVTPVAADSARSRRSVTVVFYRPGSTTPMWPDDDPAPLHHV